MTFDEVMKALGGGVPQELAEAVFGEDPKMTIGTLRAQIEARAREAQRYRLVGPPMLPSPYNNGTMPAAEALGTVLGDCTFDQYERATVEAAAVLIADQHGLIVELTRAPRQPPGLPDGLCAEDLEGEIANLEATVARLIEAASAFVEFCVAIPKGLALNHTLTTAGTVPLQVWHFDRMRSAVECAKRDHPAEGGEHAD